MKVLSIVGARPQFIKAAVVLKQMHRAGFDELLVHTGQHYDFNLSEVFFRELELPEPNYYLGIGSGRHGEQTARMLTGLEEVLLQEDPDVVVIYGDTNTTLAGALAPVKLHIPVAHVEAGLRSFNREMPEEINRIVADHCSDLLFCPTETAVENLEREGFSHVVADADFGLRIDDGGFVAGADSNPPSAIRPSKLEVPLVFNVGDVMLDLAREVKVRLEREGQRKADILGRYGLQPHEYVLTTIHRASNTDEPGNLRSILEAMRQIARGGLKVLFPVHPRTKKAMEKANLSELVNTPGIITGDPVSYVEMIALESAARFLLTDSGGVQKEAYFFGVPCIVARAETEWPELVEIGWNRLAGAKTETIGAAAEAILREDFAAKPRPDFYGDGHASVRIATVLKWFAETRR
jgi:UDP-GlcNAc3NAcA epimerase